MFYLTTPCWIVCTGRTGSTHLCHVLNQTGFFRPGFAEPPFTIRPINWQPLQELRPFLKFTELLFKSYHLNPQIIETLFPDIRYIHLKRRDLVQQAVSLYLGRFTGQWHAYSAEALHRYQQIPVPVNPKILLDAYREVFDIAASNFWLPILGSRPHITVYYEDLNYQQIFDFLHIKSPPKPQQSPLHILAHPQKPQLIQILHEIVNTTCNNEMTS